MLLARNLLVWQNVFTINYQGFYGELSKALCEGRVCSLKACHMKVSCNPSDSFVFVPVVKLSIGGAGELWESTNSTVLSDVCTLYCVCVYLPIDLI